MSPPDPVEPPQDRAQAVAAWEIAIDRLATQGDHVLARMAEHARLTGWTPKGLVLTFDADHADIGQVVQDQVARLRAVVRALNPRAFHDLQVFVKIASPRTAPPNQGPTSTSPRSALQSPGVPRDPALSPRAQRIAQARAHPMVQYVLQAFGAQIKEIKTDV